jgi:hypothetical protein
MAKTLSYSHPVLGNGDDFTIEWEIETYDEPIPPNDNCGVPVTRICIECVTTGEEAIDNLLVINEVALFLEIKCLNTCFRRWFPVIVNQDYGYVDIQSDFLQGIVKLELTLEAIKDIDGYMPSAISEFYPKGQVFSLKKGDILAKYETEFSVGEQYVEKKFNSVSWIKYRLSQEAALEPQVDYSGSDVVIDLPQDHFRFIAEGADKVDALIRCMYIAPVLANCIEKVRQADRDDSANDIGGCDWVESLKIQLVTFGIGDDDDAVSSAWNILCGSLHGAIGEINSYIEED